MYRGDYVLRIHEVFKLNKWSRRMPFNLLMTGIEGFLKWIKLLFRSNKFQELCRIKVEWIKLP